MKAILVGLVLLASVAHALCGDVNGDGVVNIGDALMVAQYDVGLRTALPHPDRCDVNHDGACNIGDALRIAQCDVGLTGCDFTTSVVTGACVTTTTTSTTTRPPLTTSTSTTTTTTSSTTTTLPPLNLTAQVQGCDCTTLMHTCSVVVTWDNPTVPIRLDHSLDNIVWTTILSASVFGQTSFVDIDLPEAHTVWYRAGVPGGMLSVSVATLVPITQPGFSPTPLPGFRDTDPPGGYSSCDSPRCSP